MSVSVSTVNTVLADKEAGGNTLNVQLHPLVIINISDHFTRQRVVTKSPNVIPRVLGAVLGIQSGRNIEILNSFEFVFSTTNNVITIDLDYLRKKQEQFRKVFPALDFLGWYSTSSEATADDIEIHKQILEFNESPLYLVLDTAATHHSREIPITIYESELHMIQDSPTLVFVRIQNWKIETQDSERIATDHVAHVSPPGLTDASQLTSHLLGIHNAIKMLSIRITIILKFLQAIKKEEIPKDHGLLRQIASLTDLLPAANSDKFREDFLTEYNDTLLVAYLATITKGTNATNELIDKFNTTYDRQNRRRGFGFP